MRPLTEWYFRSHVRGLEQVPPEPALLVSHHDGGYIPVDALCFGVAWHLHFNYTRPLHWLMHDFPFRIHPKLTALLHSCGVLPASHEHCSEILDAGSSAFVYPGGAYEAFRPFSERKHIDLGGRTGFVAQSLRHRVPIVPVVSVGAHETLMILSRGRPIARLLRLRKLVRSDIFPIWLGLPWGVGFGPLPQLPLPQKIRVQVLQPILLWEELGQVDPADPQVLKQGHALVQKKMQAALDKLHAQRRFSRFR